ncbi:hypothetical protein DIJ64_09770 [Mycobacterium leprae]|uniref:Uncharacterized protein n=1 Tax=Mycobacterium leprae TaxID=1769 RepID=A0AAD0KX45_MYCLR|nr:hypothetical protein DIJ64_09770 [Mycobacterium leprae]
MSRSLAQRYRAEAYNVIATATCTRPTELVIDGIDVTQAEFEYAVTYECALDVADHANEFDTRATAPQRPDPPPMKPTEQLTATDTRQQPAVQGKQRWPNQRTALIPGAIVGL